MTRIRRNPEMTGVLAGGGLGAVGLSLILLPSLAGLDLMQVGFALQFLGGFLVLVGLITAIVFGIRAARLSAILKGQNLLAHWIYPPQQVQAQAERDLQETRKRNRFLFLVIAAWMVACTVLFLVIGFLSGEGDNMSLFVGIMAGVLLVVGAFALGMPFVQSRRARRSSGEAYVATNGLFLNGALHTWDAPLAGMKAVSLVEEDGQARLVFRLHALSRTSATGYQDYTVEVPVPRGEEATARRIELHFQKPGPALHQEEPGP